MVMMRNPPTASTRIRDNQRRSRARRKEYMRELEQRVHEFERLGAHASAELQTAAQKVARENTLLRTLLKRHGFTTVEIEAYLRTKIEDIGETVSKPRSEISDTTTAHNAPLVGSMGSKPTQEGISQLLTINMQQNGPAVSEVTPDTSEGSRLHTTSKPTHRTRFPQAAQPSPANEIDFQRSFRRPRVQAVEQNDFDSQVPQPDGDDATSCETAAWIIANLRGHDNAQEVRTELGCSSNEDCTVKNLTVFNAMDR